MSDKDSQSGRIIGLDMHPDIFSAAALVGSDPATATVERLWDRLPVPGLVNWARKNVRPFDVLALEASGNSFEIAERLRAAGFRVVVLESQRAGQIRDAYCNNDKSSAVKLARIYLTGLAREVWQPDPLTRTRREVLHAHRKCVGTTTRMRNRIKSFLSDHGVRLPKGFRLSCDKALPRIEGFYPWEPMQLILLRQMLEELQSAERRRKELRAVMAREVLDDPNILKLVRLMGVRHIVAFALAAVVGDINRFATHKKLVAYVGLSPSINDSGSSIRGSRRLARYGRGDLRALLIQSAHNALNQPASPLHKWAWKLVLRKTHKNIAVAAVARKITVAIWYMMRGLFTPLQEVTMSIKVKLNKLATEIGSKTIKQMGYRTKKDFLEEKYRLLLETS